MSPRHRRSAGLLVAAAILSGCGGGGSVSRDEARDDVEEKLLTEGYRSSPDAEPIELDLQQADAVGTCVANSLFGGEAFSKDERDAATSRGGEDPPNEELVAKVEALLADCVAAETGGGGAEDQATDDGPSAGGDGDGDGDGDATTTTNP